MAWADEALIGPLVGHADADSAILWARLPKNGAYRATITPEGSARSETSQTAEATPAHDLTAQWRFANLRPQTRYHYKVLNDAGDVLASNSFRTAPAEGAPARVSIAFGSCAREDEGSRAVWKRMLDEGVDGVVLGGDTPYIDTTDLAVQRRRYREFASVPEYQQLLSTRPHWSTWDDHDFGRNDADGTLPGKENSRHAFTEYRALSTYGDGAEGIYSSFRWGPIEVFLLDTRWWSSTGASYADPQQKTLLGEAQWRWLQESLRDSTAPFKLLVCGVIWDDKQNKEKDDWNTYSSERQTLLDFIRGEQIGGVVLLGGDIHVTRMLKYPAESTVGYPLYQFISSPIHAGVLPDLNVPHANLVESSVTPHVFLKLTADTTVTPARLTAEFLTREGDQLFRKVELTEDLLTP
jgi:alkaline phosphatase D